MCWFGLSKACEGAGERPRAWRLSRNEGKATQRFRKRRVGIRSRTHLSTQRSSLSLSLSLTETVRPKAERCRCALCTHLAGA